MLPLIIDAFTVIESTIIHSPMPTLPFQRLLLVEDNTMDTLITTRVLKKMQLSAHIDSVASGEDALLYLAVCKQTGQYPELILLDVDMPLMNGFEFLEQALAGGLVDCQAVKVVVLTSSIHPADKKRGNQYGLAGYLHKPVKPEELRTVLQL